MASEVTARNNAINSAKLEITQIVDKNSDASTSDNYKLEIDNNVLSFSRQNNPTQDTFLKLFGSATNGTDGVI